MARMPASDTRQAVLTLRVWLKPRGEFQRLKRFASILHHLLCMCVRAHVLLHSVVLSTLLLFAMLPQVSVNNDGQLVTTPPDTGPNDGAQPIPVEGDVVNTPLRVAAHGKQSLEVYTDACLGHSLKSW